MTLLALRPYGAVALRHSVPAGVPIVILATRTRCAAAAGVRPGRRPRGRCVRAWGGGACGGVAGHGTTAAGRAALCERRSGQQHHGANDGKSCFHIRSPSVLRANKQARRSVPEGHDRGPENVPPGKSGNPAEPFLRGAIMLIGLSKAGSIRAPLRWRLISNLADALF
jgi:hypothetical protein